MRVLIILTALLFALMPEAAAAEEGYARIPLQFTTVDGGLDCAKVNARLGPYRTGLRPVLVRNGATPHTMQRLLALDRLSDYNAVAATLAYNAFGMFPLMHLLAEGNDLERLERYCQA